MKPLDNTSGLYFTLLTASQVDLPEEHRLVPLPGKYAGRCSYDQSNQHIQTHQ